VSESSSRYELLFNKALNGEIDTDDIVPVYAPAFIAASPVGIMTGKNDEQLKQVIKPGTSPKTWH